MEYHVIDADTLKNARRAFAVHLQPGARHIVDRFGIPEEGTRKLFHSPEVPPESLQTDDKESHWILTVSEMRRLVLEIAVVVG